MACSAVMLSLAAQAAVEPDAVKVDGDAIAAPVAAPGDVARGRALLVARENANCVLCHAIPDPAIAFSGDLGPRLDGVGSRLTPGQIRLRIVDDMRVNPQTIMPSYYRVSGFKDVANQYRGKTVLSAQEVEDLVAYLSQIK